MITPSNRMKFIGYIGGKFPRVIIPSLQAVAIAAYTYIATATKENK